MMVRDVEIQSWDNSPTKHVSFTGGEGKKDVGELTLQEGLVVEADLLGGC